MEGIGLAEVSGLSIAAWQVEEGALRLTFSDGQESRVLQCVCRRCHWVVETRTMEGRSLLRVRCHGCGRSGDLRLAPAT